MNRIHIKFIKWISNKFGYKITILKLSNGTTRKILNQERISI